MKKRIMLFIMLLSPSLSGFSLDAGRAVGMGGTVLLSAPTAGDFLVCPVSGVSDREFSFESGFQRRYELSDLDQVIVSTSYRYRWAAAAIGFSQFGKEGYYTEKLFRGALGFNRSFFNIGFAFSSKEMEFGRQLGSVGLQSYGVGAGIHFRSFHLAIMSDNINQPKASDGGEPFRGQYKIFAEIAGSPNYSLTGRLILEKYERPALAIGQYIRLTGYNAIFWGVTENPLTYGGGVELKYHGFAFNYAASYHPALGFSHDFSLKIVLKR